MIIGWSISRIDTTKYRTAQDEMIEALHASHVAHPGGRTIPGCPHGQFESGHLWKDANDAADIPGKAKENRRWSRGFRVPRKVTSDHHSWIQPWHFESKRLTLRLLCFNSFPGPEPIRFQFDLAMPCGADEEVGSSRKDVDLVPGIQLKCQQHQCYKPQTDHCLIWPIEKWSWSKAMDLIDLFQPVLRLLNRKLAVPSEVSSVMSVHSRTSHASRASRASKASRIRDGLRSPRSVESQEAGSNNAQTHPKLTTSQYPNVPCHRHRQWMTFWAVRQHEPLVLRRTSSRALRPLTWVGRKKQGRPILRPADGNSHQPESGQKMKMGSLKAKNIFEILFAIALTAFIL